MDVGSVKATTGSKITFLPFIKKHIALLRPSSGEGVGVGGWKRTSNRTILCVTRLSNKGRLCDILESALQAPIVALKARVSDIKDNIVPVDIHYVTQIHFVAP